MQQTVAAYRRTMSSTRALGDAITKHGKEALLGVDDVEKYHLPARSISCMKAKPRSNSSRNAALADDREAHARCARSADSSCQQA